MIVERRCRIPCALLAVVARRPGPHCLGGRLPKVANDN